MRKALLRWHKILGLIVAPAILVLAFTGVMILFSDSFALPKKVIHNRSVLSWYGIEVPESLEAYRVGEKWFSQCGESLYIDLIRVGDAHDKLLGAVLGEKFILSADKKSLSLYTQEGELVERVPADLTLGEIESVGLGDKKIFYLKTSKGIFKGDENLQKWEATETSQVTWSKVQALDKKIERQLLNRYGGEGITLERVMLDLHSGKIFGGAGKWLMSLVSMVMVFLVLSGVYKNICDHLDRRRRKSASKPKRDISEK